MLAGTRLHESMPIGIHVTLYCHCVLQGQPVDGLFPRMFCCHLHPVYLHQPRLASRTDPARWRPRVARTGQPSRSQQRPGQCIVGGISDKSTRVIRWFIDILLCRNFNIQFNLTCCLSYHQCCNNLILNTIW